MTTVAAAAAAPRRRRPLPAPVPARARRRVPGHQPRAVRAGPRADDPRAGRRRTSRPSCAVVGDADQSIYAFRGATIRNILEFERDYPDATTILLEQNYRSTQTILNAANAVIARNPDRKPKNLWSDAGPGEQIAGYVAENEHDEAAWVAQRIDELSDDGRRVAVRRRGLLPHQRAVAGVRGGVHPRRPALQGRRRRALLRAQGDPRRARLPAGDRQPRRRRVAAPHPQHPAPRHRRPRRGHASRCSPSASASPSAPRSSAPTSSPGLAPRSLNAIHDFTALMTDAARRGGRARRHARPRCSRRCSTAPATCASSRPATTRRTSRGSTTCASSSASRASSRSSAPALGEAATLDAFLEQVSLVADADSDPRRRPAGSSR